MAKVPIRYVGPYDEVVISRAYKTVARGEVVEVSARLAEGLLSQPSNWAAVEPERPAKEDTTDAGS